MNTPEQRAAERIIRQGYDISGGMSSAISQTAFLIADEFLDERNAMKELVKALEKIASYDDEPIWNDDRDDAANEMLELAREALSKTRRGE